jgi:hypothetical protein
MTNNNIPTKGNTMTRISDLEFTTEMRENVWVGHSVQTTSDASRMIANERIAQGYIEEFGDVEIVYDDKYKQWVVPAFKAERPPPSKLKQAYCNQFGSN